MASALVVTLLIDFTGPARAEETVARCELRNTSADSVEINADALGLPSLALEIVDAAGVAVRLPPPPVPPAQPHTEILHRGQRYESRFHGFVPSWTPPGHFRARCRYVAGDIRVYSEWVEFDLVA